MITECVTVGSVRNILKKWVELIRQSVETFFKANPQYLNEEDIERIGMGGEESEEKRARMKMSLEN